MANAQFEIKNELKYKEFLRSIIETADECKWEKKGKYYLEK